MDFAVNRHFPDEGRNLGQPAQILRGVETPTPVCRKAWRIVHRPYPEQIQQGAS
jgi:hypothetical protein